MFSTIMSYAASTLVLIVWSKLESDSLPISPQVSFHIVLFGSKPQYICVIIVNTTVSTSGTCFSSVAR